MKATDARDIFVGGGKMGELMRSQDWSQTSLGKVEQWSQSLKTAVRIMLTSRQPMFVWWGPELINLYNDAYRDILGGKHPQALGQPAAVVWHEIWDQIGPRAESALLKNEGTYDEALLLVMERNGYPEETYYTFSYSPVPDDRGQTSGILCANTDDTQYIIDERQLTLLRVLAAKTADARTFDDACTLSATCLGTNPYDFPFAMIYLVDPDQQRAVLAGISGLERGHALAPATISFDDESVWPIATVFQFQQIRIIPNLESQLQQLPLGAWPRSPHQAVAVPIAPAGPTGKAGILVAGLNPFRLFDDNYRGFIELTVNQIAASIANAQAYEEERQRAEALAELDRAKTTFFSNVSHEFRTPLTLLLGPLEDAIADLGVLESDGVGENPSTHLLNYPPALQHQLHLAHRNALRLLKLVNTLLDFSRIEAGRIEAVYQPTNLAALTTDLAGVFRSAVERAGLNLQVDCQPSDEPAYVDREMWEKIVLNLLSNAFKFTFEGEIRVSLGVGEWEQGSKGVREPGGVSDHSSPHPPLSPSPHSRFILTVQDNGTGIPVEELPHIFERFHRVKGARGRSYEGSGIGLALVQELVRLHGGTIEVSSVIDQGTRFTAAIPMGSAHLPCDRINADRTLTSTATGAIPYVEEALRWLPGAGEGGGEWQSGREAENSPTHQPTHPSIHSPIDPSTHSPIDPSTHRPKILLADDNTDMLDYVKRLLSPQYEVEAVRDGRAAVAAIRQERPDLVLSDVMMPELDGFELLQQLRTDPQTQGLPVILLSARAGEESRIEGLAAGADDYLVKPFSARELLARVEAVLKLVQLRQEADATLHRSEERSQLALQIAQLGTWRYDPATALVEFDVRMRGIWGESADAVQLPLTQAIERIHPEDRDWVASRISAALDPTSSGTYEIDYRIIWDDGTERWIAANGQTIFTGGGNQRQAVELWGTALDITDRRSTEAALRESEELTQRILDSSNDCIKVLTLEGQILYMNRGGLLTIKANDPAAVLDRNWIDFWQDDEREQAIVAIADAKAGHVGRMQGYCPTLSGEPKWWDVVVTPLRDATEQVVKLVVVSRDMTEQKQANAALRESEERFRCMADNAPVMVWVSDPTGYCTYLSQTWYDFSGQTEETGLGFGWLDAVHPEDQDITRTIFMAANQRQEAFQFEYRLRRKDGEYRWAIDAASPWFGVDGQFRGYIGSVMDISDRKRAEETLRQRETELRLVTNSVPALISFIDADQRYRFTNQGYEEWFAQPTVGDIYGKHIREVVGEATYAEIRPYVEQVLAGEQVTFERQALYKDGVVRHVNATYVPRFDSQGTVEGFVALVNDISAIKQAEAALRQSEERYRYLAESIPQLVWTADAGGRLLDVNQRWTEFTGLSLEQAQIGGWQAVVHPEDIPTLNQKWTMAQQAGTDYQAEGRMRQMGGGYRWHLHQAVPLKNKQGRVIKWFGTATDIEEQKQLEQQRSQLLEREQAAREAAEAANRTKDEFLAVVSHELRSPLNPILGWSTLLKNGVLDEAKTQKALAVIERNAKLQTELIDDLLDISRMLRGKLDITVRPVNLAATIQAATETVRLAAEAKSIQINLNLNRDVGLVSGDATRLQQIVWNLLSNAVKFTPNGGQVDVKLEQVSREERGNVGQWQSGRVAENPPTHPPAYAQLIVSDTGTGITPDFLPYIFDYFRQADSATTRQFGGLGLGLAIVRHLVELHGGTIQANSLGKDMGATFVVTLPTLTAQQTARHASRSQKPLLDLQDVRILVVDDEPDTRDITRFILRQAGARVVSVSSANEALTVLQQTQPQVLVSDIGMPDIDGYMLMRQIRTLAPEQGGQIPAIALTAYASEIDYERVVAAGFQKHVPKPVDPNTLVEAVASLVKQQE
ncbi:MAG: PAS domain S-box protein [Thainema sp.]